MKKRTRILLGLVIALALLAIGRWSAGGGAGRDAEVHTHVDRGDSEAASLWTCPMHPQIRLPDPGGCPICGMDLVPMDRPQAEGDRRLAMTPEAVRLAGIRTTPVERRSVFKSVPMVGKVDYDETAVSTISAWVPGRLDRLFVDYTGVSVRQGDHLVRLYSPELVTAQEELLSAKNRLTATAGEQSEFLAASNRRAHGAARQKLVLLGLTEAQVDQIEARGTAEDHVMLTSPASGVVIRKDLDQGAYVQTGTPIYSIADLSRLWVRLDAYEQDLPWLRYGQKVSFETEAIPGEVFRGSISFIHPVVDERTRTVKVRVNVENPDGRLKPGMFVRATARAGLAQGGLVMDPSLAGKWISPMHPEIIKDGPGACDVCGMDLVPAEELGLVPTAQGDGHAPLVVPTSAVLVTGKRAVVYVEVPDVERPTYEGREVVLGPRAGDVYLVSSGLDEGERVVTQGAFRIDSSMQIRAKPSMMSMPGEAPDPDQGDDLVADGRHGGHGGHGGEAERKLLKPVLDAYLSVQRALAADDPGGAHAGLEPMLEAVESAEDADLLPDPQAEILEQLHELLHDIEDLEHLEELRTAFAPVSRLTIELVEGSGAGSGRSLHRVHCPMALDFAGADWLQTEEDVSNPYFGASMLRCGSVTRTWSHE